MKIEALTPLDPPPSPQSEFSERNLKVACFTVAMITTTTLLAYLVACAAIIVSPGPAQALVLARTVSDGRKAGILTAIGLNVGTLVHASMAAVGLSAVLATSAVAFGIVKFVGAGYLGYLGVLALRGGNSGGEATAIPVPDPDNSFRRAVLTGTLNPKVALFFLAFLPQFVDPSRGSTVPQFLMLGALLAALDTLYESSLAVVADQLRNRLTASSRFSAWRQKLTGTVLIGLGVRLAFVRPH